MIPNAETRTCSVCDKPLVVWHNDYLEDEPICGECLTSGKPEDVTDHPPRCPECATIVEYDYPASRADRRLEGKCATHGLVGVVYGRREDILGRRHLHVV